MAFKKKNNYVGFKQRYAFVDNYVHIFFDLIQTNNYFKYSTILKTVATMSFRVNIFSKKRLPVP